MKIGIATGKSSLDDKLSKKIYEPVTVWSDLNQVKMGAAETDILILSTDLPGQIINFILKRADKIIILLTDQPDQIKLRMAHVFICNIYVMEEEAIVGEVVDMLESKELIALKTGVYFKMTRSSGQSKLIVAYSPVPGQGKTTFMKNLSAFVADKNRGKKVAVVDLNVYDSELLYAFGFEKEEVSAKRLENYIEDDVFIYKGLTNLHILPHISSPYEATRFTVEAVFKLLEQLKQRYDYVFVEISSYLSSHTAVIPMMNANHVFVIATEKSGSLRAFERWFPEELKQSLLMDNKSVHLILNDSKPSGKSRRTDAIASNFGIPIVARLPHLSWGLENGIIVGAMQSSDVLAYSAALQEITRQSGI